MDGADGHVQMEQVYTEVYRVKKPRADLHKLFRITGGSISTISWEDATGRYFNYKKGMFQYLAERESYTVEEI